jgi:predicted enzyme related to lactoylglutathione lyase
MNPVVHFEMPYVDASRMAGFYQQAFGWQTQSLGPEMGNYVVAISNGASNPANAPPGTINGGFFPRGTDPMTHAPSVVISVDDIQDGMRKVAQAGGKVLGEPMEIPGVGQYVSFTDPEGNRVSMLQPLPRA